VILGMATTPAITMQETLIKNHLRGC
jgi:hypothetical protein